MKGITMENLRELRDYIAEMLDDPDVQEIGVVEVQLTDEDMRWILDQLHFALRNDDDDDTDLM